MSTLVAQTISNGTVSTSSANVIQGSAKAWVNFNGTGTVAIRASYNVSSITDNGTGEYTVNFTNSMPDANYCTTLSFSGSNDSGGQCFIRSDGVAAGSVRIELMNYNATANADRDYVYVAVFR